MFPHYGGDDVLNEREQHGLPGYWQHDYSLGIVPVDHTPRILAMRLHTAPEHGRPSWLRRDFDLNVDPRQQLTWVQGQAYVAGDQRRIGQIQAWHAPVNRMTMLWEVLLDVVDHDDPRESLLYRTLWRRSEQVLTTLFPETATIVTPGWDPDYNTEMYHSLLTGMGYSPVSGRAWGKRVT